VGTKVATQLTFAGKYNATPAWSPKGDKILFAAQRIAEGNFDLYIIDPDGNNLNRLTNGERPGRRRVNSERPSWSQTGRHFAFSSNEDGQYAVYIMSVDGTQKRRISPKGMDCRDPAWSLVDG
jgi:TolB protein